MFHPGYFAQQYFAPQYFPPAAAAAVRETGGRPGFRPHFHAGRTPGELAALQREDEEVVLLCAALYQIGLIG